MGNFSSKSPSNMEKLQEIVETIDEEEKSVVALQRKKKVWDDNLAVYGMMSFLFATFVLWIRYKQRIIGGISFVFLCSVFFLIVCLTRKIVIGMFELVLSNSLSKLSKLRMQKQVIMDLILKSQQVGKVDCARDVDGKPILVLKIDEMGQSFNPLSKSDGSMEMHKFYPTENRSSDGRYPTCSKCSRPLSFKLGGTGTCGSNKWWDRNEVDEQD